MTVHYTGIGGHRATSCGVPLAAADTDPNAVYACPHCGYRYEVAVGDASKGFAAGTPWAEIPAGWNCPDCAVRDREDFVRVDGATPDRRG